MQLILFALNIHGVEMKRFPKISNLHWVRALVLVALVTPVSLVFLFGKNQAVEVSIVDVTQDSSGDLIVTTQLKNVSNQTVSFPGQSADFLFFEVEAPNGKPRGLVGWCGTESMNYIPLLPGETMNARAVVESRNRDDSVRVAFFQEGAPSSLAQTASAVSDQVPFGQSVRIWVNQWSQKRGMVYSPRFVPSERESSF
tara:strand:- start:9350 stop:9943 length:594 start_codon:yes stop_codon:yes gene_type:complete